MKGEGQVKSLLILAEQGVDSPGAAIARLVVDELERAGAPLRVHDLYAMRFQPALQKSDFEAWQKGEQPAALQPLQADVSWADLLILVYPIRLGGTPAMLKGYIDRVLAQGFAYGVREGRMAGFLTGKRSILCPTTAAPADQTESMRRVMGAATLAFCGVEIVNEPVDAVSEYEVRQSIRAIVSAGH